MKFNLHYYSHRILQSQLKWLFSIIIFLTIYYIFNFNYIENMGNCCSQIPNEQNIPNLENLQISELEAQQRYFVRTRELLQQENTNLLFQNNQLHEELVELAATNQRNVATIESMQTNMREFIDEMSQALYSEEAHHMETYKKLQICIEEKARLQEELNSKR